MMQCTDRHFRFLARLLSKHSRLEFNECEHPLALQLGGSSPAEMQRCVEYAAEYDYDEVNINAGCPSDRVQAGRFGACLMLEPATVADCIRAMKSAADIEVTVKARIGVDDHDSYPDLTRFVDTVAEAGCTIFIIHARKAFLSGLSPKQNRTVPPLRYDYVYRLKQDFPDLKIVLNGGLADEIKIMEHLQHVDGVMVGREAYDNPYSLAGIDAMLFHTENPSRREALEMYKAYVQQQLDVGVPLATLARHLSGLFHSLPGAKAWRKHLNESSGKSGAGLETICTAEQFVTEAMNG